MCYKTPVQSESLSRYNGSHFFRTRDNPKLGLGIDVVEQDRRWCTFVMEDVGIPLVTTHEHEHGKR